MVSGAEQFPLDVDLDSLRAAQQGLQRLADHLATVPTRTGRILTDVNDGWTGPAAKAMTAELAGLGAQCKRFGPMFHGASLSVKSFADAVEAFQTMRGGLVRQWDDAESEARDAYRKADWVNDGAVREAKLLARPGDVAQARADAGVAHGKARDRAADSQHQSMARLDSVFAQEKAALAVKAKFIGAELEARTIVVVPDGVARDFIGRGGGGLFGGLGDLFNRFPMPDLGIENELSGMTLVHRKHAIEDADSVAGSLQNWREHGGEIDPAVLAMLAKRQEDPDFASTLLQELGPEAIAALPGELSKSHLPTSMNIDEAESLAEDARRKSATSLLNSLGVVLAAGTSATGDGALPDTWTPQLLAAAKKDGYASVVALVSTAQRTSGPNVHFGSGFLNQAMNALTDDVSANGPTRLNEVLDQWAPSPIVGMGPDEAGDRPARWLPVDDPTHVMFQALGANQQASTQWLHQGLEHPPSAEQAGQGHFLSSRVEFWLTKPEQAVFGSHDRWGADKGEAFGNVLAQGMTSGGALALDSAQNTAFFFRQMGAKQLTLPDGAKEGVRAVFVDRVDALNWNTLGDAPKLNAMLRVDNDPNTPGRDDTGQPRFHKGDVEWLLKQSFETNVQVAGYAGLSLGHLRQDFNDLVQASRTGQHSKPDLVGIGESFGQWKGLLTGQNNDILLTNATEKEEKVRANKAFASFVVGVLTESIPGGKAFDKLGPTFSAMATATADGGKGALTESVLSEAFPENAYLNPALRAAGAAADASYSDGKAILVQWAMENGMVDQRRIDERWGEHLPDGVAKSPHGYAVNLKLADAMFGSFVQDSGDSVLRDLGLDSYVEGFTIDPAGKYEARQTQ